jgi:gluconate kinase
MILTMLLILFGLPGAGKTFAGQLLHTDFGFAFHEADDDIPHGYRQQVLDGQVVDEPTRDAYHRYLIERIAELHLAHPRLAVAAPLLRDRHRQWIHERFPEAVFILVLCEKQTWQARLKGRTHTISLEYAQKVANLNEPATVPHMTLDDSPDGPEDIRQQVAAILAEHAERDEGQTPTERP